MQFVNQAGLSSFATIDGRPDRGRPREADEAGARSAAAVPRATAPSRGWTCALIDDKGAEKGRVDDEEGRHAMCSTTCAPGKYRVSAAKTCNGRSGSFPRTPGTFIDLKPGMNAQAPIVLYLRGG